MIIQETKCTSETLEALLEHLWKGSQVVALDAQGASGSMEITWNPYELALSNFLATPNTITSSFHILGTSIHGKLTNVYGPQQQEGKSD